MFALISVAKSWSATPTRANLNKEWYTSLYALVKISTNNEIIWKI